jgi:hypothetical protein
MLPFYQRSELEYDNRIKARLNKALRTKYTNEALIRFESDDAEAEELYIQLQKILYLMYALLQESHSYLFSIGVGSLDANHVTTAPLPAPRPSYQPTIPQLMGQEDLTAVPTPPRRGRPATVTSQHLETALAENRRATVRAVSGVSNFRGVMGQILKLGNNFQNIIKKIAPRFNYLSQEQVDDLADLCEKVFDTWDKTIQYALPELSNAVQVGTPDSEIDGTRELIRAVRDEVFEKGIPTILQLISSYNPIVAPASQPTINTNARGDGYTLDSGNYLGTYV